MRNLVQQVIQKSNENGNQTVTGNWPVLHHEEERTPETSKKRIRVNSCSESFFESEIFPLYGYVAFPDELYSMQDKRDKEHKWE